MLPVAFREQDHIVPGQEFSIERLDSGEYLIGRIEFPQKAGVANWLLSCPEKDWFQPLESESTDTL